jgi:hypothetical protein
MLSAAKKHSLRPVMLSAAKKLSSLLGHHPSHER